MWSVAWVLCRAKPKLPSLRWMLLLLDSGLEDKLLPLINDVPSTEPLPGRDRADSATSDCRLYQLLPMSLEAGLS